MINVETYKGKSISEHRVEIVERKGTGHPDFICDSVMEAVSIALSAVYLREFGVILHHNIDKGLLVAGQVKKWFGGGEVVQPMEVIIGDRATFSVGSKTVPVKEIAVAAVKNWFARNLRLVDPERHVNCRVVLAPGSTELTDIFSRPGKFRVANDTSAAVGYYPLSPTEQVVLELERYLNGPQFKEKYPESGEDIKVMGLRREKLLDLTVAMPLLAGDVGSERDYFARKEVIRMEMAAFLKQYSFFSGIDVHFNTLDQPGRGLGGVYLSLLGTSAEDADSGQVGRGNRVNGLISLNRPMGTEAAAGKNPVSHVGKIYNILAHRIARKIYEQVVGIKEVYVLLLSRIGEPIDQPSMAAVQVLLEKGRHIDEIAATTEEICAMELARINNFCRELGSGVYPVC
jgi:S-adenosylmethionine synthetase